MNETKLPDDPQGGFHWRDGWHFQRLPDGSVWVTHVSSGPLPVVVNITVPAPEWASIVCSVSAGGETRERWIAQQDFHNGTQQLDDPTKLQAIREVVEHCVSDGEFCPYPHPEDHAITSIAHILGMERGTQKPIQQANGPQPKIKDEPQDWCIEHRSHVSECEDHGLQSCPRGPRPPRIDLWDDETHTARLRGPQAEKTTHFEIETAGMTGKPSKKAGFYTIAMFDEGGRTLKLRLSRDAREALRDLLAITCEEDAE